MRALRRGKNVTGPDFCCPSSYIGKASSFTAAIFTIRADHRIGQDLQVLVRDNNVDQALKVLKRKMQREGIFREMRARRAYEKPSERRNREAGEAVRRARKVARKQAVREGLIAAPKKKPSTRQAPARAPAAPAPAAD